MSDNPLVSVIIAVYRSERYIEKCARSLFEQTLKDIEFIFVDDCSDDKSMEILRSVLQQYPNRTNQVIIHRMKVNSGQAAVRKWAMLHASGDFVIHCDSDDWVKNDMYESLYNEAIKNNADLVICDYYLTDGQNNRYVKDFNTSFMPQGPICNKMVKRSLYLNKDFIFPIHNKAEDCAMITQWVISSTKIIHIPNAYYYYYINETSICHDISEQNCLSNFEQEVQNLELRLKILDKYHLMNKYKGDTLRWQYAARENLTPLLNKKKYRQLWLKSFPKLSFQLFFNKHIPIHFKLIAIKKDLKVLLGLY